MAKSSVEQAILRSIEGTIYTTEMLPREHSAIFIGKEKITSDPTKALRYKLSKFRAKEFLKEVGWSEEAFELTGWDWLDRTLTKKPVMFRIWLSKQHSNFCATGRNMKRCGFSDDDRCPSCWDNKEKANHLCRCPSEVRTKLFLDNVGKLEQWLTKDDKTNSALCYWTIKYIQARGSLTFAELGPESDEIKELANAQDKIGWRNLMEGRVATKFYMIQQRHLLSINSRMNGDDWMHGFIARLIHISHSQWLLRNFSLHDQQCGFKRLKDKAEVLMKIEELRHTDPNRIPEHSRFLLEIDTNILNTSTFDTQSYWVAAMEAARDAQVAAIWGNMKRPKRSQFGVFQIREEIRKDMRDMYYMPKLNKWPGEKDRIATQTERQDGGITGLTESDRRRKPD